MNMRDLFKPMSNALEFAKRDEKFIKEMGLKKFRENKKNLPFPDHLFNKERKRVRLFTFTTPTLDVSNKKKGVVVFAWYISEDYLTGINKELKECLFFKKIAAEYIPFFYNGTLINGVSGDFSFKDRFENSYEAEFVSNEFNTAHYISLKDVYDKNNLPLSSREIEFMDMPCCILANHKTILVIPCPEIARFFYMPHYSLIEKIFDGTWDKSLSKDELESKDFALITNYTTKDRIACFGFSPEIYNAEEYMFLATAALSKEFRDQLNLFMSWIKPYATSDSKIYKVFKIPAEKNINIAYRGRFIGKSIKTQLPMYYVEEIIDAEFDRGFDTIIASVPQKSLSNSNNGVKGNSTIRHKRAATAKIDAEKKEQDIAIVDEEPANPKQLEMDLTLLNSKPKRHYKPPPIIKKVDKSIRGRYKVDFISLSGKICLTTSTENDSNLNSLVRRCKSISPAISNESMEEDFGCMLKIKSAVEAMDNKKSKFYCFFCDKEGNQINNNDKIFFLYERTYFSVLKIIYCGKESILIKFTSRFALVNHYIHFLISNSQSSISPKSFKKILAELNSSFGMDVGINNTHSLKVYDEIESRFKLQYYRVKRFNHAGKERNRFTDRFVKEIIEQYNFQGLP